LDHASKYYKILFGPWGGALWPVLDRVTDQENEDLIKPFLEEEIKIALFQMKKKQGDGPDGMTIEFYHKCWSFIKKDICDMFDDFYLESLDIQRINYGIITLLPKVKDANMIQQFRPIYLLNCVYKLFTKCFTIRLESVAGRASQLGWNLWLVESFTKLSQHLFKAEI
jgi:hypothetical protein